MYLDLLRTASITLFLMFMLGGLLPVHAQPHPITMEKFSVEMKVKYDSVVITSFVSSLGQHYDAEISEHSDLQRLKLNPGASILGEFRFEKFASEGGLGTTRRLKGCGKGQLSGIAIRNRGSRTYEKSPVSEISLSVSMVELKP